VHARARAQERQRASERQAGRKRQGERERQREREKGREGAHARARKKRSLVSVYKIRLGVLISCMVVRVCICFVRRGGCIYIYACISDRVHSRCLFVGKWSVFM